MTLDGLRGVAAAAVVCVHLSIFTGVGGWLAAQMSVDFFFALSGFVLAYAYDARLATGMGARAFFFARMRRLYPLYFAGLAVGFAFFVGHLSFGLQKDANPSAPFVDFVFGLAMLPSPMSIAGTNPLFPLDAPSWSLFFELIANVVYAAIAPLLSKKHLIVLTMVGLVLLILSGRYYGTMNCGHQWRCVVGGFPRVVFFFFGGILFFRIWPPKGARTLPSAALSVAVCLGLVLFFAPKSPWFDLMLELCVYPVVLFVGSRFEPGRIAAPAFAWAGAISYAVYALHYPILQWIDSTMRRTHNYPAQTPILFSALSAFAVIAIAGCAHLYWDVPLRRWMERKADTGNPNH